MTAPTELRSAIIRDLRPTRPLPPPWARSLMLAPLAAATVAAVPLIHFFRPDLAEIGFWHAWGLSALEACAGVAIVALALRESIPGRLLPARAVVAVLAGGLAVPLAVLRLTGQNAVLGATAGAEWAVGAICFRTSVLAAMPSLAASAFLVARGLAVRPGVTGALYGLGSGLIADSGLRLFCEFTVRSHIVFAHESAVVIAMCAGFLAAQLPARLRP